MADKIYSKQYVKENSYTAYFTSNINATKICLNGKFQNYVYALQGTEISYSLSAPGYYPVTGKFIMPQNDVKINKELQGIPHVFKIGVSSNDDIKSKGMILYFITDVETDEVINNGKDFAMVTPGKKLRYTAIAPGYRTLPTNDVEMGYKDITSTVVMLKKDCDVTFNFINSVTNTIVYPNINITNQLGETINEALYIGCKNDELNYTITVPGFNDVNGKVIVENENQTVSIKLEPILYNVDIKLFDENNEELDRTNVKLTYWLNNSDTHYTINGNEEELVISVYNGDYIQMVVEKENYLMCSDEFTFEDSISERPVTLTKSIEE